MRKLCHQQVNRADDLCQTNLFHCLEMTPAALKCQLIAVELCNLETSDF